MEIIEIKDKNKYLNEYIKLCYLQWSNQNKTLDEYIEYKINNIKNTSKIISVLGLIDNDILIGFISLYRYDGDEKRDLTPWYATMYVKKEYRKKGYSRILNTAIIDKARKLGYNRVYLKSNLKNYYEKFGAKYVETLNNGEKLYYIDI